MFLTKKAMTAGFLVTLIITLLSFVLIAGTIMRFYADTDDVEAELLCKNSVAFRAATALKVAEAEAKLAPVMCRTVDKEISGDQEYVQKYLADKMVRCWWMFNEGRYKESVFENIDIFGGDNKCFTCYTITIKEDKEFKEENAGISADDFANFLATTDYEKYDGKYLDYIQSAGGPGIVRGLITEEGIKPGKVFAISYKAKASECTACEELIGGGVVAGGLTLVAAALTSTITIPTIAILSIAMGASATATGVGIGSIIDQYLFRDLSFDEIVLVDMSDRKIWEQFASRCEMVTDIAGK